MTAHDDKCLAVYEKLRPFLGTVAEGSPGYPAIVRWMPRPFVEKKYVPGKSFPVLKKAYFKQPTFTEFCEHYGIPPVGKPKGGVL